MASFFLYKGLKKPLVLFGLKDKYIYYTLGTAVFGIICLAALPSMIGWIGFLIGAAIAGGGIWYIYHLQDTKGLYTKLKNDNQLHIFPKRFNKHILSINDDKPKNNLR